MLEISCPHCGPRAEIEFWYGGEATDRPLDPHALDARAWSDQVFYRTNAKGTVRERWWHAHGCLQWIVLMRDTATNSFVTSGDSSASVE
jgi:sarcosine oxidase subunit delta